MEALLHSLLPLNIICGEREHRIFIEGLKLLLMWNIPLRNSCTWRMDINLKSVCLSETFVCNVKQWRSELQKVSFSLFHQYICTS